MIFVTVGTQEPFDRLIKATDDLALLLDAEQFVVQAINGSYKAKNFEIKEFISAAEFAGNVKDAKLIISHAGMGTIISALESQTPLVVIPRLMKYQEHRNEHQLATAKKMEKLDYVEVIYDEQELIKKILAVWPDKLKRKARISTFASTSLTDSIKTFIEE